jgi:hypothetical protein
MRSGKRRPRRHPEGGTRLLCLHAFVQDTARVFNTLRSDFCAGCRFRADAAAGVVGGLRERAFTHAAPLIALAANNAAANARVVI